MNLENLVEAVASRTGIEKYKVKQVVDSTFDIIKEISQIEPVSIRNFGKFSTILVKGRTFSNPLTKAHIPGGVATTPDITAPRFYPSKFMRHLFRYGKAPETKVTEVNTEV